MFTPTLCCECAQPGLIDTIWGWSINWHFTMLIIVSIHYFHGLSLLNKRHCGQFIHDTHKFDIPNQWGQSINHTPWIAFIDGFVFSPWVSGYSSWRIYYLTQSLILSARSGGGGGGVPSWKWDVVMVRPLMPEKWIVHKLHSGDKPTLV